MPRNDNKILNNFTITRIDIRKLLRKKQVLITNQRNQVTNYK